MFIKKDSDGKDIEFLNEEKAKKINQNKDLPSNVVKTILDMFAGEIFGITGGLKELYEERAGIIEFDGRLTKESAEAEAIKSILNYITYFGSR